MLSKGYRAFDNIGGNYALPANSTKICLLGYFCMQNSYLREKSSKSYDFREKCKRIEKIIILVISVNLLRFSLKLLSRISEKVKKYVFRWKRRQIKQN